MSIDLACPKCRQKYRLKDELAGKKAKCAKCGESIKVPSPVAVAKGPASPAAAKPTKPAPPVARPPVAPIATKPVAVDPLPDLSDLFDDSFPAAAQPTKTAPVSPSNSSFSSTSGSQCPKCSAPLEKSAVLCVKCGYNTRTGERLSTKRDASAPSAKQQKGSVGTLMKGTLFSGIGALLGAGVWVGIAIATGYEIGWIAWGLGAAAGVGMAVGHEDDDGTTAGLIAAAMSIVGILAAKVMCFEHLKSLIGDFSVELVEGIEGADAAQGEQLARLGEIFNEQLTFASMFSPYDALFFLLAVGSAYKLGSGQATD